MMEGVSAPFYAEEISSLILSKENFTYNEDRSAITANVLESQQIKIAAYLGLSKFSVVLKAKFLKVLPRINPSDLKKELTSNVPDHKGIEYVSFTRNKAIVVNIKTPQCALEILQLSHLKDTEIQPHLQNENISTRFILHKILTDVTLHEIANELIKKNLFPLEIRRFFRKALDGSKIPTKSVLVTIIGTHLPKEIKLWQKVHKVSQFIDKPKQCLNCWRFNHSTLKCRFPKRCVKCGKAHILANCMSLERSCCNCQENHFSNDKNCPKWAEEKEFLCYKGANHLPIIEARKSFAESKRENQH